ncbi:MAG: glutathione S-transferase family protein [Rhodospirillaceae bacterium]|nr:MAG: glutathione S-transferase family protein [Rhodospirillaceae bacterium]
MKLYSNPVSPFGARITIAQRAKGITIAQIASPGDSLKSPEFLKMNPVGKIPVLVTESGNVIPESEAILNYLEDRFPTPSLRPTDPEQRARVNVAIRMMDTYVMAPVIRLFPHLDPAQRDARTVEQEIMRWKDGLSALAHFMATPLPEVKGDVSLADCILPPSLQLSSVIATMFGLGDLTKPHNALVVYYARMSKHPIVGQVLDELTAAQAAYH